MSNDSLSTQPAFDPAAARAETAATHFARDAARAPSRVSRAAEFERRARTDVASHAEILRRICASYDSWITRAYVWGRFRILRRRFLDEIGQYLPPQGRVLDIGCGFGLFSLYFAATRPRLRISGFDLNANRIATARVAAAKLGLANVEYEVKDARAFREGDEFNAAYMMDIIHHIPFEATEPLLRAVAASLTLGGVLLVKDVDTKPSYKRLFTRFLDLVMDPRTPVRYWSVAELQDLLESLGFRVNRHQMRDVLPYPHVLYVCHKTR